MRPGARVLDIGSGWGGMALYLARICGAEVIGITLSQEQLRVATERAAAAGLSDRVSFRLQDYREVDGQFDNIVSVGMFEHVGLRQFPVFFRTVRRLLAPDGVMLLHSMAQPQRALYNQPFMEKYIFPGGYIPALSEVIPAVEKSGLLDPRHRDPLAALCRDHARMAPALPRQPRAGARALRRALHPHVGVLPGRRRERLPLRRMHVFHLQLALDQTRVPLTRDYIAEAMARLTEAEAAVPEYAALHDVRPHEAAPRRSGTS